MTRRLSWSACGALWLLVFGLVVGCSGGDKGPNEDGNEADGEAFSPIPDVPGSGVAKGRHRLVEVGVVVRAHKRDGDPWDEPSPEPDPRIEVWLAGKRVAACDTDDAYEATCALDNTIAIDSDTLIELKVLDKDIAANDRIGEARLGGLTSRGTQDARLPMQVRGQLEAAHIRLTHMPTWLDRYKARIVGLLIGVLAGLLLWFAFEKFWLRGRHGPDAEDDEAGEEAPTTDARAESVPAVAVEAPAAPADQNLYRVRCKSCGAMATSAHQTCEYCGEPVRDRPPAEEARK